RYERRRGRSRHRPRHGGYRRRRRRARRAEAPGRQLIPPRMRNLRTGCAATMLGACLLPVAALPVPAWAAQPAATPLDGRPPLSPGRADREPLPDPEVKDLSLGKVELGARPDVTIREIRFAGAGVPANVG